MNTPSPANDESTAQARLAHLVAAWNRSSFETYCDHFTQPLIDHYNPGYFTRIRTQCGQWLSNQYLGCLRQGGHQVYLWRARCESAQNDALFSLTLTADGKIAGLLKRFAKV